VRARVFATDDRSVLARARPRGGPNIARALSVDLLKAGPELEQRQKIRFPAGISADFRLHRGQQRGW